MYISTNWLKNFIKIDKIDQTTTLKTNEFEKILAYSQFPTDLLTLTGFEVEDICQETYKNEKDIIIELDTTPNRSDVNNMVGFSREISSLMNFPLRKKSFFNENKQIPSQRHWMSDYHVSKVRLSRIGRLTVQNQCFPLSIPLKTKQF